jgi:hypothetical protein
MKMLGWIGPQNRHADLSSGTSGKMIVHVEPRLAKRVNGHLLELG